ncbi:MAG TPA: MFS transporter, partial [Polyangiaceae bacterium]|nr:MFS transporter [Polyangiaceae bacterium]
MTPKYPLVMQPPPTAQIDWTLLGAVALGALLSSMTASVINVALPDIAREFHVDPSRIAWVVLAFLLTVTVLLLLAGRLGDMIGPGRVYLLGFTVFGIASLGSALAPTTPAVDLHPSHRHERDQDEDRDQGPDQAAQHTPERRPGIVRLA